MVGVALVAGGLFRLGWIADLLSVPVTTGFLAGISVHILISQLPRVLGLPHQDGPMTRRVLFLAAHLGDSDATVFQPERNDRPGRKSEPNECARNARAEPFRNSDDCQDAQADVQWEEISIVGTVAGRGPPLSIPSASINEVAHLISLGLLIAAIVMVQTAATTRSFPSDPDQPPDVERDYVGVGAGSILSGLFGAFPLNASPPRTAIVSESGGRSQLTGSWRLPSSSPCWPSAHGCSRMFLMPLWAACCLKEAIGGIGLA